MTATAQQPASTSTDDDLPASKWWPLAAVCIAVFMLLLDVTIVNVALPNIQSDLSASFSNLEWVVDAYALTLAAFQLTSGSLGDRLGRKRLFIIGIGIFAGASLACGLAPSAITLDWFRALQGVGGSIMFSNSLALIGDNYSGRDRGTAFGIWGATTGASVAIGPLVGGALTSGISWRWIFFINVPIAAIAIYVAARGLRRSQPSDRARIDPYGLVLFSGGLVLLILGLIRGNDDGWTSKRILALLIAAVVLLVAFVVAELRIRQPMLDVRLFRRPGFIGAQLGAFGVSATMFALFLYLTLYIQDVLGYSALQTGLRFLPFTLLSFLAAPLAGKASGRATYRWLIGGGLVLAGIGQLLLHGVTPTSSWTTLLLGFILAGLAVGTINPPVGSLAVSVVEQRQSGMGAGTNNTFRQVGLATGIAAYGALFQNRVAHALSKSLSQLPAQARHGLTNAVASGGIKQGAASAPKAQQHAVLVASKSAFIAGFNDIVIVSGTGAVVAGILCMILIRNKDLISGQ